MARILVFLRVTEDLHGAKLRPSEAIFGRDFEYEGARMQIDIRVECHAGYRADERPLRFTLRGRLFEVTEVEDRWYSPGAIYFRVRAEDGNFYILRHDEGMDVWTLDAFRTSREYEITAQPLDVTTPPGPHGAS